MPRRLHYASPLALQVPPQFVGFLVQYIKYTSIQFYVVRPVLYSAPYNCLNPYYGRTSKIIFGNRDSTVTVASQSASGMGRP